MEYATFIARLEDLEADYGERIIQVNEMIDGSRSFFFSPITDQHDDVTAYGSGLPKDAKC